MIEAPKLVVPRRIPDMLMDSRLLTIVRNIFDSNGCLGEFREEIMSGSFFSYGPGPHGRRAKRAARTSYLVRQNQPVVILEWNAERMSLYELDHLEEMEAKIRAGFGSRVTGGYERYRIATLEASDTLQEPTTAIEVSLGHEYVNNTALSPASGPIRLSGSLVVAATEEVSPDIERSLSVMPQAYALAATKVVALLTNRAS